MSQLRMRRWRLDDLPPVPPLPEGCLLRTATADDASALAGLLTLAFGDPWDAAKVRAELLDHPGVPATFVVEQDGALVATASYQLPGEAFPESGWVHWVGADPAHSGRGLGVAVVLAVLRAAFEDGKQDMGLTTDDGRLPAIRTYRKLGFEPDPCDPDHAERWVRILGA